MADLHTRLLARVVDDGDVILDRPRYAVALQAVVELHVPGAFPDCRADGDDMPCPTLGVIAEALGEPIEESAGE